MKTSDRKEAYRDKARAMLELWGAEITQMRAKAHMLQADARIEAMNHLDELERFYNDAFRQYGAPQESSGTQLEELVEAVA